MMPRRLVRQMHSSESVCFEQLDPFSFPDFFLISFLFLQDYSTEKMCRLKAEKERGKERQECCSAKNRFMTVLELVFCKVLDHSSRTKGED